MTKALLTTALLTALLAPSAGMAGNDASDKWHSEDGLLTISAQGIYEATPDKATLTASLWEDTPAVRYDERRSHTQDELRDARSALERRMSQVVGTLESAGIPSPAIEAGEIKIAPRTEHRRLANNNHERYSLTRIERPITVSLEDIERVPAVIETLSAANVNHLTTVNYGLQDQDAAKRKALVDAIENARADAEAVTGALGVSLAEIQRIDIGQPQIPRPRPKHVNYAAEMAVAASNGNQRQSEPAYRAGEITQHASASVVWRLDQ